MTDIIRVDHDALAKIADGFGKESAAVAQMLQQVTRAMQQLQNGGWLGRGSEAFFAEMEQQVIPAVRRLIEALAEADRTTNAISTTMKSADEEASSGFRNEVTNSRSDVARESSATTGLVGETTSDSGPGGVGLFDGGLGMAADEINRLLGSATALWEEDGFSDSGLDGATLDNNFFPGEFAGSDSLYNSDNHALGNALNGSAADYGLPADWLAGVNDSLSDYLQSNYNDYGIPRDWLDGVQDAVLDDLVGDDRTDSDARSLETGDSSGDSGGSSGGSSGDSSGGSSGGETGGEEASPLSESREASSSPSGSSAGGMGSDQSARSLDRGRIGGDSNSRLPSELSPAAADFPSSRFDAPSATEKGVPGPLRFAYQSVGSSSGEQAAHRFTALGAANGGALPIAAPTQANMGLPLTLAAVGPLLALLGKALKRKTDDR